MMLEGDVEAWARNAPGVTGQLKTDAAAWAAWHRSAEPLVARLARPSMSARRARRVWRKAVELRHGRFLEAHLGAVARQVGLSRLEPTLLELAELYPWLAPTPTQLAADANRPLAAKVGFEYKSAVLVSRLLAHREIGAQLLQCARRPAPHAQARLRQFLETGLLEHGKARLRREGVVGLVEIANPLALNAEDDQVLDGLEACVDVALLDPQIQIGVLRGARVDNRKYSGRRVFCSGIDLNALYGGALSHLYFAKRELGLVSKLYRGLLRDGDEPIEKPWIAAVDAHAIGGGLQLLLVLDYVIAERGAKLSLPAGREAFLPGAASLRLPRFLGERGARQALYMDRSLSEIAGGKSALVDDVVAADRMDEALAHATRALLEGGVASLIEHRQALRLVREPLASFQEYMASFARAQGNCHFSDELIANLERDWITRAGAR